MRFFTDYSQDPHREYDWALPLLLGLPTLLCLSWSILSALNYLNARTLAHKGELTDGMIIERLRIAEGGQIPKVDYFLRYTYVNPYADPDVVCLPQGEYRTTPKKTACPRPIRVFSISQDTFKTFDITKPVRVRYLPSDKKTLSRIEHYDIEPKNYVARFFLAFFLMLVSGRLFIKSLLAKD